MSASTLVTQLSSVHDLDGLFDKNADQLRYWYDQLSELNIHELTTREELITLSNALRLIMQYEHANAEELKELAEREAVETAEREENWEMERELLKEEISVLRERITSKADFNDANETFRAEIDSLTSENAMLRQQVRERDRELADQRDRTEEISTRLQNVERERSFYASNQSDLEEQIRELNRRIHMKTDVPERSEWETRRFRQRSEQAIALSNQLQSLVTQNEELKSQADRVTAALENATALINEQATKFAEYSQQLREADAHIERLMIDNRELRMQLSQKDANLNFNTNQAETTGRELLERIAEKEAEIERLNEEVERLQLKIEELNAHLHIQHNEERDAEMERLREELIVATQTARQLFGTAITTTQADGNIINPSAGLRIQIVELDHQLKTTETELFRLKNENSQFLCEMEQKDIENARLNKENQRLRKTAFGDASEEIYKLEQQIQFRERQIQELNRYCSLLQIDLHEHLNDSKNHSKSIYKDEITKIRPTKHKTKKNYKNNDCNEHLESTRAHFEKDRELDSEAEQNYSEKIVVPTVQIYSKDDEVDDKKEQKISHKEDKSLIIKRPSMEYVDIEPTVILMEALHNEILSLKQELSQYKMDLECEQRLQKEREILLHDSKLISEQKQRQIDALKAILFSTQDYKDIENASLLTEHIQNYDNQMNNVNLKQQVEELKEENMELQRLADSIKTSGSEIERRMAEATRRIVFLTIQNFKFERRANKNEMLRKALAHEYELVRLRLQRIVTGEERKSRQLTFENEINLIEIARLQNMLLHSVPLSEYQNLLNRYKSFIQKESISENCHSSSDGGYYSTTFNSDDELKDFDISMCALAGNNSKDNAGRWTDELIARNKKLSEENDIFRSQCEYWKHESQKKDTQVNELNAFLVDIENETELKSMIVNLERRLVQAVGEQLDIAQDHAQYRNEGDALKKQLQRKRVEWRAERQSLVDLIIHLRNLFRKLDSDRINIDNVSISQLEKLKKTMDSIREREKTIDERLAQIEKDKLELERKMSIIDATNYSYQTIVNNDYQLKHIQSSLQSAQLSILTLTTRLQRSNEEIVKWQKLASERKEQIDTLESQLDSFNLSKIDLQLFNKYQEFYDEKENIVIKSTKNKRQSTGSIDMEESSEISENSTLNTNRPEESPQNKDITPTVLIDNSVEYQRYIEALKSTARLCIENYEEQLAQKDKVIDEYRKMLESIQSSTTLSTNIGLAKDELSLEISKIISERPLTSAQIIGTEDVIEERNHRIHLLEREIHAAEKTNSALAERLEISENYMNEHKNLKRPETRNAKIQVDIDQIIIGDYKHKERKEFENLVNARENHIIENRESSKSSSSAKSDASTPASDANSSESETDSGTVDDIEMPQQRPTSSSRSSHSSESNQNGRIKKSSISVDIPPVTNKNVLNVETESIIAKHHNETRRLRMRIVTLERKIKQLTEENNSMKERKGFGAARRPTDADAEIRLMTKENERLHRANRNLANSLQTRMNEIEELQKRLKKSEAINPNKIATDVWEERKRHARIQATLKQRVTELTRLEEELRERLARREKFIEQVNRESIQRHADMQKWTRLQEEWRAEKLFAEKRENEMNLEIKKWMEKYRELNNRIDIFVKENKLLNGRCSSLQERLERISQQQSKVQPPQVKKFNTSTQTFFPEQEKKTKSITYKETITNINDNGQKLGNNVRDDNFSGTQNNEQKNNTSKNSRAKTNEFITTNRSENNNMFFTQSILPGEILPISDTSNSERKINDLLIDELMKKLRRAELMQAETAYQLNAVNRAYNELLNNYRSSLSANLEQKRESAESTAIAVLRDKLVGKDREIEHQRNKIVELERKLWNLQFTM